MFINDADLHWIEIYEWINIRMCLYKSVMFQCIDLPVYIFI